MKWTEEFKRKSTTAQEAVSIIKPGDKIFTSGNAATSYVLLNALADRKDELTDVEVTHVLLIGNDPLSKPEIGFFHPAKYIWMWRSFKRRFRMNMVL